MDVLAENYLNYTPIIYKNANWVQKEKVQSKMIMQLHDELVFDVPKNEVELMKSKIDALMKNSLPVAVPMEVGMGVGANWLEAH